MKLDKDVILFVCCLIVGSIIPLTLFGTDFYFEANQDIQFHDTYFVFTSYEFAIVTSGLVLFISFLIRGVMTKFKNTLTQVFFGIGLIITGLISYAAYEIMSMI